MKPSYYIERGSLVDQHYSNYSEYFEVTEVNSSTVHFDWFQGWYVVEYTHMLNTCMYNCQMVAHLKQRVQELKDELSLATGEEITDELTPEEKDK